MNKTLATIYSRRAVRKYKPGSIDRNVISEILDAGRMAPSAMNTQPWRFYVLTDREDIRAFSKAIRGGVVKGVLKMGLRKILKLAVSVLHFPLRTDVARSKDMIFYDAPVVIFITAPRDYEWAGLDIGMCTQNMMLAAKSMGLDTCPIGSAKYVEETKLYTKLQIPKTEKVELALVLGHGDEQPPVHDRLKDNVVYI